MSAARVEPLQLPRFEVAVALLGKISASVFTLATDVDRKPVPDSEAWVCWAKIRSVMQTFYHNRSIELDDQERTELYAAMRRAHELAHAGGPNGVIDPERCGCSLAVRLVDFSLMLALDEGRKAHNSQ